MEEWMESEGSRSFPLRRTLSGPLGARAAQVYANQGWRKIVDEDIPAVGQWVIAILKEPGLGRIVGIVRKDRSARLVIVPAMYECRPEVASWTPAPIAFTEVLDLEAIADENCRWMREGVLLCLS